MAYYLKRNGKVFGPFEAKKLRELASCGRLLQTDMISADGGKKWGYVADAKGLKLVAQTSVLSSDKSTEPSQVASPEVPIKTELTQRVPSPPLSAMSDVEKPRLAQEIPKQTRTLFPFSAAVVIWILLQIPFAIVFFTLPRDDFGEPKSTVPLVIAGTPLLAAYLAVVVLGVVGIKKSNEPMAFLWGGVFVVGMLLPLLNWVVVLVALISIRGNFEAKSRQDKIDEEQARRISYAEDRLSTLFQTLVDQPGNKVASSEVMMIVRECPSLASKCYQAALNVVQYTKGDPASKVLALELGRIFMGNSRPAGMVTVYDEQAINNDIKMRCVN